MRVIVAVEDGHMTGIRYSASGLPPGLAIDPDTGTISGTPERAGSYSVTVTGTAVLRWPWSWLRRLGLTRGG